MTWQVQLLTAVGLLYLVECILVVPRAALLFWSFGLLGTRLSRADDLPGSPDRAVFLAPPLPPLAPVFAAAFCPVAIDLDGVANRPPNEIGSPRRHELPPTLVPFETLRTTEARGRELWVNGARFADCAAERIAASLAALLRKLAATPRAAREPLLDAAVAHRLDAASARAALADARAAAAGPRLMGNALFLFLFAAAPWAITARALSETWPVLLAVLLLLWVSAVFAFRGGHRVLRPTERGERRYRTLLLSLTPLAAIRAADALTRDQLAGFHPLAIAAALLDPPALREFARSIVADLRHPPHPPDDPLPAEVQRTLSAARARLRRHVESFAQAGVAPLEGLLAPPPRDDENCVAWCPRCLAQYVRQESECAHCPGLPLVAFPPGAAIRPTGSST